jgi:hypothetical protein
MRRKILAYIIGALLFVTTAANGFFLYGTYADYHAKTTAKAALQSTQSKVTNAEQLNVGTDKQGTEAIRGTYAFEERDVSKIDPKQAAGQLLIASNESRNINYLVATGPDTELTSERITKNWTLQKLSSDPMWAPGACSSKPTFFLQHQYIFIDDGKTHPDDKYGSYVVFDMLAQKYRYFGGNNFTDIQATKEKILKVTDENDQIVYYIDPMDASGPLAGSPSFKHARGSDHGYIIRRVIDLATLHYTDYKLKFKVPAETNFNYYYVSPGTNADERITLTSDTAEKYYSGKVENNAITLTAGLPSAPNQSYTPPNNELALALSGPLQKALPGFVTAQPPSDPNTPVYSVGVLGEHDSLKYLDVYTNYGGYGTPVVYDSATKTLDPLTDRAILSWGNYVALGVF